MDEKILVRTGLTRNEAKVYLTLLEHGPLLAGSVASRSGIHRRSVYDLLERLIQKGLVSYIMEEKRKKYEATNPTRLLDMMKHAEEDIAEILPMMQEKFAATKEKQGTVFYKGKEGIKAILADQLETAQEILVLGASPQAQEIIKYYFHKYDEIRKKKGITMRMIFNHKPPFKIPHAMLRYLPMETKTAINIYGHKVAILHWSERPFGILITHREIAESFRSYFEILWSIAGKSF